MINWHERMLSPKVEIPQPIFYSAQGLIDIIIPVFNDRDGLRATLCSIGTLQEYNIIIVDDCSTDVYDDIIDFFKPFHNITLVRTSANGGPAVAKNCGIQNSKNKYIMFIDAGDTFLGTNIIAYLEAQFEQHPNIDFISTAYYESGSDFSLKLIPCYHNSWKGKVYRRSYVQRYKLHFTEECSFSNDDIGMNMLARLISSEERILHLDIPSVIWQIDMNSVVRRNNCANAYKDSIMGVAIATEYALSEAKKLCLPPYKLLELNYASMCHIYFSYLSTINARPEFTEEAFNGAKYYYDKCFKDSIYDSALLVQIYNQTYMAFLQEESWSACIERIPTISFQDFLMELEKS
jgi:glycosyltransferase involved in cell wall biosynthesis